jgi:hypothetical protein
MLVTAYLLGISLMTFVSEYDGSTMINRIPRNPMANINPIMPGGG